MASLPGINDVSQPLVSAGGDDELHRLVIKQGLEWKVEVSSDSRLNVKVKSGIAEIFGTELATGTEYTFKNYQFSIFAVEDVELEWRCPQLDSESLLITANTTAKYIYNLHFALEKMRSSSFEGPRVLVIGDKNCGRTTLCRILCSYAIKFKSYQPMYVNLDPQQAVFSPPGCLTATPISDILDVECSTWGQSMTSGATPLHSKQPLVKSFGLERIAQNKEFYLDVVEQLAQGTNDRILNDSLVRRSGALIDIPSLSELDEDFNDLVFFAKKCKANVVVMLGITDNSTAEKIANKLSPLTGSHIVSLPELSGCLQAEDTYSRSLQRIAIREYFYGTPKTVLSPYAIGVDLGDIMVYRPRNLLEDTEDQTNEFVPVTVTANNLQHALVAITYADKKATPQIVQKAPLLGFGLITEVNEKRNKLRILLPVPGALPNKAMVLTSYRYLE